VGNIAAGLRASLSAPRLFASICVLGARSPAVSHSDRLTLR
jgi:hypothetical protein